MKMSNGLELLAKHGRLDCAYEQIIFDFPDEFEVKAIDKAHQNLARLEFVSGPKEHPAATEDGH
jgi:hypothetical protein